MSETAILIPSLSQPLLQTASSAYFVQHSEKQYYGEAEKRYMKSTPPNRRG